MKNLIKLRGIQKIVHFHTDHFEPEAVCKAFGHESPRLIAEAMQRCSVASGCKPSLFFKIPFGAKLKESLTGREVVVGPWPDDPIVFVESSVNNEISQVARQCIDDGYDVHIHVHHERWTRNDNDGEKLSSDEQLNAFIRSPSNTRSMDSSRFMRYCRLCIDWLRVRGWQQENWAFIHGCWALNASDLTICQIKDEIVILNVLGCRGDFSFPAGRPACDPAIKEPYSVKPVSGVKSYDSVLSDPIKVRDLKPGYGRFLIWNHDYDCGWKGSIDYSSADTKKKIASRETIVKFVLRDAPVIDGICYIKTHAHSLQLPYFLQGKLPLDCIGELFTRLNEGEFGVPIERWSVRQVLDTITKK